MKKMKNNETKKYFIVSDIHGYFKPFKNALDASGYDQNNDNHILIILGDLFDRGNDVYKIYKFIKSIPEERIKLIRGNHEDLLVQMIERGFPIDIDVYNGTFLTAGIISKIKLPSNLQSTYKTLINYIYQTDRIEECFNKVKTSEIYNFIINGPWLNYYEINSNTNFIFTHGSLPIMANPDKMNENNLDYRFNVLNPNFRIINSKNEWEKARWALAYKDLIEHKLDKKNFSKNTYLVVGHYTTFHIIYDFKLNIKNVTNELSPIIKNDFLICIDTCTTLTKKVNVLIIENDEIKNKNMIDVSNINY